MRFLPSRTDLLFEDTQMFRVTAFYKFSPVAEGRIPLIREDLSTFCEARAIHGLFLLGHEGCNATMSGGPEAIEELKEWVLSQPEFVGTIFKDSECEFQPFRRFKIDLREEIVTLKRSDLYPHQGKNHHMSPEEWHKTITSGEDILLLDTRNTYETEIGMFRGAVDPRIAEFSEFPDYVKRHEIPKDKKILMYCTGGIRCEKAILFMQEEGFENVFQLDGGILNYFKEFPEGAFDGECFVFDHRVAVDSHLRPSSQYRLCPHCGNPAKSRITCARCENPSVICDECEKISHLNTCSKNCAYHVEHGSARRS